jgi:orotate phosphoribosyltransferase
VGAAREPDLGVPFAALLNVDLPTYEPDKCPLCAQGLPVVKPGSRPVAT